MKQKALIYILLGLLLIVLGCSSEVTGPGTITKKPTPINLEQSDKDWILAAARTLVEKGSAANLPEAPSNVASLCGREVWISVFRGGAEDYAEAVGLGDCLVDGLRNAGKNIRSTDVYKELFSQNPVNTRIKVDILDVTQDLKFNGLRKLGTKWEPGWWGASTTVDGKRYYILPDSVVFRGWGLNAKNRDSDKLGRRKASQVADYQFARLAQLAGLSVTDLKQADLSRFTTVSFIEENPGKGALDLMRGNVVLSREFNREQVIDSAIKAADQLLRHQDEEGKYGYWYMTDGDEFSKSYGVPRHAGTVWGLLHIYKATGEKRFLESAKKGLEWMVKHVAYPQGKPNTAVIEERKNRTSLFTQALATLSIIEMPEKDMSPELLELQEKLGNALLVMENGKGLVYTSFSSAVQGKLPDKQPVYAPGESALALIQLYLKDGKQKWLDCARRICDFQIEEFERTGKPDNWIIQDLSLLYQITKEPKYLEYGYKTADFNVKAQWKPGEVKGDNQRPYYDYLGGFNNSTPPRSTPAGSRTEAMDAAYALAKFADDKAAMKKYGDSIWQAMWFMMNHQVRPENAFYLRNPEGAMGGIKGGLIDNNIRIDYNQHVIMAMLSGLQVFDDRPGVSTTTVFSRP